MKLQRAPQRASRTAALVAAAIAAVACGVLVAASLKATAGGLAAAACRCPVCPPVPLPEAGGVQLAAAADGQQGQQTPQQLDAAQAAAQTANHAAGTAAPAAPPLCPPVPAAAEALAEATAALEASLAAHFEPYKEGFTLEDILQTAQSLGSWGIHDTVVWTEVRNGTLVFPRRHREECSWFCNMFVEPVRQGLQRGLDSGRLRIPERLPLLLNVHDDSVCRDKDDGSNPCGTPLFGVIRSKAHRDVPVPPFVPPFEPHYEPWAAKQAVACWRGSNFCKPHELNGTTHLHNGNCSREALSLAAMARPDLLNVTLIHERPEQPLITPALPVPHAEFARFRYLINLDGYTASRRLATLLAMNSLVLKQQSKYEEWYHAALRPCVHYLPIWQHSEWDAIEVVEALRNSGENDGAAQRMAANAQLFAAAYFNDDAVYRHWQKVIDKYASLYRGAADPVAGEAARAQAERIGKAASRVGELAEQRCVEQRERPDCYNAGRDAAIEEAARLQLEAAAAAQQAKAAAGAQGGGSGGGGSGGGAAAAAKGAQAPAEAGQAAAAAAAAAAGEGADGAAAKASEGAAAPR